MIKKTFVFIGLLICVAAFATDPDGWDKAKWGMSEAKIKALYSATKDGNCYSTKKKIWKKNWEVTFEFDSGKLASVDLRFLSDARYDDFWTAEKEMLKKYGEPTDKKYHPTFNEMLVWSFPKTTIYLMFSETNRFLSITYKAQLSDSTDVKAKSSDSTDVKAKSSDSTDVKIGDRGPAGGWIFYDKGNSDGGWRYLEAAPEDQADYVEWGCNEKSIPGANGTAIGTGKANTAAIIKSCGEKKIAAKLCTAYRGGGKSDWFLPSKDELKLMYENLHANGVGGFAALYYWSSSEYNAFGAWNQYFSSGAQYDFLKDTTYRVRAVRAF